MFVFIFHEILKKCYAVLSHEFIMNKTLGVFVLPV